MSIKAMKQAVEALEECRRDPRLKYEHPFYDKTITALRTAIAEAEKQDNSGPINDGWQLIVADGHSGRGVYAYMTEYPEEGAVFIMPIEQAEKQEPVAEVVEDDFSKQVVGIGRWLKLPNGTKLYTTPPAAPVQEPVDKERIKELEDAAYGLLAILERTGDGATVASVLTLLESKTHPPAAPVHEGCACRWDHEDNRVATCERHQGWLDVIAEWADRAREAEAKLKAKTPAAQPAPDAYNRKLRQQLEQEWVDLGALKAAAQRQPSMVVSQECGERGCMAHDDRVDGAGVVVGQRQPNYDKTEMNAFVQNLYDQKMREGKHGHYETMFHVVHRAIERAHGITGEKK